MRLNNMELETKKYRSVTEVLLVNSMILVLYVVLIITYLISFSGILFRVGKIMVLFNAFIFGFKLYQLFGLPICLPSAKVAIGETAVMIIG